MNPRARRIRRQRRKTRAVERLWENAPYVCPGCYAVDGPCLPGCIDAEIEAEREDERRHLRDYECEDDDAFPDPESSEEYGA